MEFKTVKLVWSRPVSVFSYLSLKTLFYWAVKSLFYWFSLSNCSLIQIFPFSSNNSKEQPTTTTTKNNIERH
ncbi:hypothetical protein T09_13617 [Trichinella sp. T9]|nr:hypothetical protein T09_13617 [Trichinella sp. T9]